MSDTSKVSKTDAAPEQQSTAPADPTAAPVAVVDPRLLVREEGFQG